MAGRAWSEEEIRLLHKSYSAYGPKFAAEAIGRSPMSVRMRAFKDGIVSPGYAKPWTTTELATIASGNYCNSQFPGRSESQVRAMRRKVKGLPKNVVHRDGLTARVLTMLSEGPVCAYDVVLEHGCRRSAASMCLGRLARSGRVERFGGMSSRMYRLTT